MQMPNNTHRTYPGHIFATAGFIVIHVNPLQLEVRVAHIAAGGVDAVLITEQKYYIRKFKLSTDEP